VNKVKCTYSTISEHDMDVMIMQLFANDPSFVELFLGVAGIEDPCTEVTEIELSKTEPRLGESDIVVTLLTGSKTIQLLIEDKIDAVATPEQPARYIKRGEKAVKDKECDAFYCYIVCPQKYYDNNDDAQQYPFHITYETIREYLSKCDDQMHYQFYQQINQAIEKAKRPAKVILNEKANAFFRKYKDYQENKYPDLDLRTRRKSNGYWAHYGTRLVEVFLYHKIEEGKVDLTFNGCASHLSELEQIAEWLRVHGITDVRAVVTGKAGALRISVPQLKMNIPFEENDENDIRKCFDAVCELIRMANVMALAGGLGGINNVN